MPREAAACARGQWAVMPIVLLLLWAGPSGGPWAGKVPLGVWAAHGCTTDQLRIRAAPDQEPGHFAKQNDQVWPGKSVYIALSSDGERGRGGQWAGGSICSAQATLCLIPLAQGFGAICENSPSLLR